jgi:hypothetical protein
LIKINLIDHVCDFGIARIQAERSHDRTKLLLSYNSYPGTQFSFVLNLKSIKYFEALLPSPSVS